MTVHISAKNIMVTVAVQDPQGKTTLQEVTLQQFINGILMDLSEIHRKLSPE